MQKKMRNQKGFTLVEIAIVLVIIGLLIAGIIKGQEMVKSGKVKKSLKQMDQIQTAIVNYQDKNGGALPADFAALKSAGLVTDDAPENVAGSTITLGQVSSVLTLTSPSLPSVIYNSIDANYDDGDPATGDMKYTSTNLVWQIK